MVLTQEDLNIQPFADIIIKATHSQLFQDPECWSGKLSKNVKLKPLVDRLTKSTLVKIAEETERVKTLTNSWGKSFNSFLKSYNSFLNRWPDIYLAIYWPDTSQAWKVIYLTIWWKDTSLGSFIICRQDITFGIWLQDISFLISQRSIFVAIKWPIVY